MINKCMLTLPNLEPWNLWEEKQDSYVFDRLHSTRKGRKLIHLNGNQPDPVSPQPLKKASLNLPGLKQGLSWLIISILTPKNLF
jgi:hypothetical protein